MSFHHRKGPEGERRASWRAVLPRYAGDPRPLVIGTDPSFENANDESAPDWTQSLRPQRNPGKGDKSADGKAKAGWIGAAHVECVYLERPPSSTLTGNESDQFLETLSPKTLGL